MTRQIRIQQLRQFLDKNISIPADYFQRTCCRKQLSARVVFDRELLHGTRYSRRMVTMYTDFQLVCGGSNLTQLFSHPLTYYSIMTFVGSISLGPLADMYGRYRVSKFLAALLLLKMFGSISQTFLGYLWCNVLAGFVDNPIYMLNLITLLEMTTWRHRAKCVAIASTWLVMVYPVDMLSRGFVQTWRWYNLIFSMPGLVTFLLFTWRMLESPRWQLAKGMLSEATDGLTRGDLFTLIRTLSR